MPSGTISGSTSNQYIDSKIEYSYTQNVSANTSTITATLYYKRNNTGYTTSGTGKFSISIGGITAKSPNEPLKITNDNWVLAFQAAQTIAHEADGTKSVNISATGSISGTTLTATYCSKTITLNTIPRAAVITSANSVTLGSKCGIKWTPASTSFYYKVKFSIEGWSYTTVAFRPGTTSAYTYSSYTIPMDVATNFPKAKSGTMTATLYTYSDSAGTKQIGSASSKTFAVTLPDNADTKPSVTMTLSPDTPYEKFKSLYLQGKSKVKATFSGSGKYGASVSSYGMQVEGKTQPSPNLSDTIIGSGSVSVVGMATDSRGYTNTVSGNISVIAYSAPYIAPSQGYRNIVCERCTEDGTASDSGTYLHVQGTRNYTKINTNGIVNTCSVRCRYKPEGGSWSHGSGEGVGVLLWTDTSTDEFDVILDNIVTDKTLSYTVELNIIDDTYSPSVMVFNIPSEDVAFHLLEGGKGAAFGKYASRENMMECEWDARFNRKLYHQDNELNIVIEQGTKDVGTLEGITVTWHYRKWLDGSLECWCRRNATVNVATAWGTALYYGTVTTLNYPFEFTEKPMCHTTCEYGIDALSLFIASCGSGTNKYATPVMLCRADSKTVNCDILYHVYGRWK